MTGGNLLGAASRGSAEAASGSLTPASRPIRRMASVLTLGGSLAALLTGLGASGAAAAAPALPGGGRVAAGAASIGAPIGSSLTITQTSRTAILDWSSFSIGAGGAVRFANGSGATLNRVTGGSASQIEGLLSSSGSVYLLNPNGVIIGKTGVVNIGGSFVASTLDMTDSQFMAGGDLTFSGASSASVSNRGSIVASGGDAVLIGAAVENDGQMLAPGGTAGLAAGHTVVLRDQDAGAGKLSVLLGGAATSATNDGLIEAASAELRANGGDVYALAVNPGARIEVTGVSTTDGNVFLVADGGSTTARGEIDATRADRTGGLVETSGTTVDFAGLKVKAGDWLIDPTDLTVELQRGDDHFREPGDDERYAADHRRRRERPRDTVARAGRHQHRCADHLVVRQHPDPERLCLGQHLREPGHRRPRQADDSDEQQRAGRLLPDRRRR